MGVLRRSCWRQPMRHSIAPKGKDETVSCKPHNRRRNWKWRKRELEPDSRSRVTRVGDLSLGDPTLDDGGLGLLLRSGRGGAGDLMGPEHAFVIGFVNKVQRQIRFFRQFGDRFPFLCLPRQHEIVDGGKWGLTTRFAAKKLGLGFGTQGYFLDDDANRDFENGIH